MNTEAKQNPISPLLRIGGTLAGAALSALTAALIFFIAAVLNTLPGEANFQLFAIPFEVAGTFFGFARPRQALHAVTYVAPDLCAR
jgi:hypothetical protein